jgi:putative membrane protein
MLPSMWHSAMRSIVRIPKSMVMPHFHHIVLGSCGSSVLLTVILVLIELIYLKGWLSLLFCQAESISAWHAFSFLAGLCLIWAAVASPIAALDHELLTIHMLQHLLLMTLAPPLIWLAEPAGPILRGLPRRFVESLLVPLSQWWPVKKLVNALSTPKVAWLAASAALVVWHIPIFFGLGMQSTTWHLFEYFSFFATGLLFWRPVIRASAAASEQDLSMILYLFFATLPCDILSGILVFSDRVIYSMYFSSSHLLGLSPLLDQQCAAALMWTCVTVVYFVAGAILTVRLLSPQKLSQGDFVQLQPRVTGIDQNISPSMVSQSLEAL